MPLKTKLLVKETAQSAKGGSSAAKIKWMHFALAALLLPLYGAFLNYDYSWDAMAYAQWIEKGFEANLLFPHHLLFHVSSWGWYQLGKPLFSWNAMESVQWLNVIAGVAGVLLIFQIIYDRIGKPAVAALLALTAAFSSSYWRLSVEHETYILPLALAIFALFIIQRYPTTYITAACVAVIAALAALLHQTHIFMVAAIAVYLFVCVDRGQRTHYVLFFLALAGLIIVIPYLCAAWLTDNLNSISGLFQWLTLYNKVYGEIPTSLITAIYAISGFTNAFYNIYPIFEISETRGIAIIHSNSAKVLLALLIPCCGCALAIIARSRKYCLAKIKKTKELLAAYATAGALYAIFAIYWEPWNYEFWVSLVPLVIVVFGLLMRWDGINKILLLCIVIILFTVSFMTQIYPKSKLENNRWYPLVNEIRKNGIKDDDLVIVTNLFPNRGLKYIGLPMIYSSGWSHEANINHNHPMNFSGTLAAIEKTFEKGRRVFISKNVLALIKYAATVKANPAAVNFYNNISIKSSPIAITISKQEEMVYELMKLKM